MNTTERPIWTAYARTATSPKTRSYPIDHATADGKTTLCGIQEIGGYCEELFPAQSDMSCKRCRAAIAKTAAVKSSENHCKGCGYTIANYEDFCSECLCEEDGI